MSSLQQREKQLGVLLWSIAFPGFGQLINNKYGKAFILIVLEVIINVKGNLNDVIVSSFLLNMEKAVQDANYLWLMFYPCIYLFAIWDAYNDAGNGAKPYIFIPFVFSAYFGTLGVIYSVTFSIGGHLIGPVFLPIIAIMLGFLIGLSIRQWIVHRG